MVSGIALVLTTASEHHVDDPWNIAKEAKVPTLDLARVRRD
jgi:hypothetical protein